MEFAFPASVEISEQIVTNLYVFLHLALLDGIAQFVLINDDFQFKCSHFFHQVFIQLIFIYFAALISKDLHFGLDDREDQNLFILV